MSANNPIQLNSVQYRPSTISRTITIVGGSTRMASGRLRTYIRAKKSSWSISWKGATETVLNQLKTLAALNTTFTFVDDQGTSFTVLFDGDVLQIELAGETISIAGLKYYELSITINEE